jgi:diguanylate cyclase (GGDEF)-like protein
MAYQLKEVLAREVRDGRLDKLTGLANRKGFYEQVEIELERQSRYGHPIAVAYIDIDDLKQINDSLGHSEGDRVIQAIGGVFSSSIRVMDIAARIGGDEFAIVFPELDIESAEKATQKIRSALGGVRTSLGPVKASIGVAIFATSPDSVDDMLRAADRIMYSVKNAEKDAVRIGIA